MKKLLIIVVCLLLVSGCYDYRELNNMAVIDGILVDYEDDEYKVKLEIVKSDKNKDGSKISNEMLVGSDKNISKAFSKAVSKSSKEVYLGHVSLLIITEELANNGISNVIDYVLRDINISNDYAILVSNSNEVYDMEVKDESISQRIVSLLNERLNGNNVTVDMVGNKLLNNNIDLVIPYMEINEEMVTISKIGCFRKDKLYKVMDDRLYNFLMLDNISISFNDNGNVISVYDKEIKFDVREDSIKINIECYGKILEIDKKYNLDKLSNYNKLSKLISNNIRDEVMEFIESNKDIIGFKDMYYKKFNKNKDIDKYELNVSLKINKNGAIYEVLND